METVQQNGRFTLFSSKFPSYIYSILFAHDLCEDGNARFTMVPALIVTLIRNVKETVVCLNLKSVFF